MAYFTTLAPWAATGDTTPPDSAKISLGWIPSEQPPAPWLNYATNRADGKINELLTWGNLVNGDLVSYNAASGSAYVHHPPTLNMYLCNQSYRRVIKSVWDQLRRNEELLDVAFDQSATTQPNPLARDESWNEFYRVTANRCGGAAFSNPLYDGTNGNFFSIHTETPARIRVASKDGYRMLVSGYKKYSTSADYMLRFTDDEFDFDFGLTYAQFLTYANLGGSIGYAHIDFEDFFILDGDYIVIQVMVEDPATAGNFTLMIVALKYSDESWDFEPNWGSYKLGAGGVFTKVVASPGNPKVERCCIEPTGSSTFISVATLIRPTDASSGVFQSMALSNGATFNSSDSGLAATDYPIAGACSDGQYCYAVSKNAGGLTTVRSFSITNPGTIHSGYPVVSPDALPVLTPIKSDGHYVVYGQQTASGLADLYILDKNGSYASIDFLNYDPGVVGGLGNHPVALTSDGTAFWFVMHNTLGAGAGTLVRLIRLDPASIFPGSQDLIDMQVRQFYLGDGVSNDEEFFGDLVFTGRDLILNWTQDNGDADAGKISRFANSINR